MVMVEQSMLASRVDPFKPRYERGIWRKKGDRMPLVSRFRLAAATIVLDVGMASLSNATAQAAPVTANLAVPSTQNVIVLLRNQHIGLAITRGRLSAGPKANSQDQSGLISTAPSHGAGNLRGFDSSQRVRRDGDHS